MLLLFFNLTFAEFNIQFSQSSSLANGIQIRPGFPVSSDFPDTSSYTLRDIACVAGCSEFGVWSGSRCRVMGLSYCIFDRRNSDNPLAFSDNYRTSDLWGF